MLFFVYSIQIKYGSHWGDTHPSVARIFANVDDLDLETYEFNSDENLAKVLVKSEEHIFGIRLITNTHSYGDLTSHKSIAKPFTLPKYHTGLYYQSVAYFTGYAGTATGYAGTSQTFPYVSGLQIHHHYENCQGKFYLKFEHLGLPSSLEYCFTVVAVITSLSTASSMECFRYCSREKLLLSKDAKHQKKRH